MRTFGILVLVSAFLFAAAVYLAPLKVFNTLVPFDAGARAIATDVAYGPGPRHRLDVYGPDREQADAPIVVVIYGGSWNSGNKSDYAFLGRALAARGFVAMVIDYQLVPNVRFPAFVEDCARAVAWARQNGANYGGAPSQLFLLGHSAGAYNAAMVALVPDYLQRFKVTPEILSGVVGLAGPYDFLPLDTASTIAAFGKTEDLAKTQPVNFVSNRAPAMLLATGVHDETVYPRHSKDLARRLQNVGTPAVLKLYPNLSHAGILLALSRPLRSTAPVLDDVVSFFRAQQSDKHRAASPRGP